MYKTTVKKEEIYQYHIYSSNYVLLQDVIRGFLPVLHQHGCVSHDQQVLVLAQEDLAGRQGKYTETGLNAKCFSVNALFYYISSISVGIKL